MEGKENILYFNKVSTDNIIQITNFSSNEVVETFNAKSDATENNTVSTKDAKSDAVDVITEKIDINTASKEELMTLSGVGKATSDNIIAYREKTPFTKIEDIKNVKNIGEKTFIKIEPYIMVK